MLRRALEDQEADEWTEEERNDFDGRIDLARQQVSAGDSYCPDRAREKLNSLRAAHLSGVGR